MKPFLIILISLLTSLTAFGQQPEYPDSGFTDRSEAKNITVNGKKEGKWVEYHASINDKDVITKDEKRAGSYNLTIYKAGIPYGIVRIYWINKNVIWCQTKKNDYKNGYLYSKTPYVNGVINGMQIVYEPEERVENPYVNGKINGVSKQYYCIQMGSGLKSETPYVNDTIVGIEKYYNENGKLRSEVPYVNGKKNGVEKGYYDTGELAWETTYENNKAIKEICYDGKGNKIKCYR